MGWLCRRGYGGYVHGFTLTLLGHARLRDGRERGTHLQDSQDENPGWHLRRSPEDREARAPFAQGEMGAGLHSASSSRQGERAALDLGM